MAKKRSQSDIKQSIGSQSGGVNIGGIDEAYSNINVGGDVVGRDKVVGDDIIVGSKVYQVTTNYGTVINQSPTPTLVDHSQAPLKGYGLWISKIEECEGGQADRIVERARQAGLSHLMVKIGDGPKPHLESQALDIFRTVLAKIRQSDIDIQVWGVHCVRGVNVQAEAAVAAQLVSEFQLNGYIADVGSEFNNREPDARSFFQSLRASLTDLPLGLSTFQYPSFQGDTPWPALLEQVSFVMPKIYWELAHNPGAQLTRSLYEYGRLTVSRPVFPIGAAYAMANWQPTASDLREFIQTARDLGLNGASFYHWDWLGRPENRELWAVLEQTSWQLTKAKSPPAAPPESSSTIPSEPPPASPIPTPTFERRFIQIIRNDEVDKVTDRLGYDDYIEVAYLVKSMAANRPGDAASLL